MTDVNFIVWNEHLESDSDIVPMLFEPGEEIRVVDGESTIADVLVLAGVFSSKSQARKNYKGNLGKIEPGFHWLGPFGKGKAINVWSPVGPLDIGGPIFVRNETELEFEFLNHQLNMLDECCLEVSFSYGEP